jgi:uncharacterized protein YkwD
MVGTDHRRMKAGPALLSMLAALCAVDAVVASPPIAEAVNAIRARGCGGRAPSAALRADPRLDRAARELASGRELKDALRAAGYRATQAAVFEASGSQGAIERALAERGCKDIADPAYRDLGAMQGEGEVWIVLAAPLEAPAAADAGAVSRKVLSLVNEARSEKRRCGWKRFDAVPPLALSEPLQRAAAAHAADMAARAKMGHAGSDGSTPAERATRAGYAWRFVGENVASGQSTPEQVMAEWLVSAHHCANLMSADFTEMGVAFAASPAGVFWAQVFGRPGG